VTDKIRREINYSQAIHGLLPLLCNEGDEEAERIAVAALGIAREVAFLDHVFQQKASDPKSEKSGITHEISSMA
jgi:hypothetical protein